MKPSTHPALTPPEKPPTSTLMLNNATLTQLRALKLQGFADALQQRKRSANDTLASPIAVW